MLRSAANVFEPQRAGKPQQLISGCRHRQPGCFDQIRQRESHAAQGQTMDKKSVSRSNPRYLVLDCFIFPFAHCSVTRFIAHTKQMQYQPRQIKLRYAPLQ